MTTSAFGTYVKLNMDNLWNSDVQIMQAKLSVN